MDMYHCMLSFDDERSCIEVFNRLVSEEGIVSFSGIRHVPDALRMSLDVRYVSALGKEAYAAISSGRRISCDKYTALMRCVDEDPCVKRREYCARLLNNVMDYGFWTAKQYMQSLWGCADEPMGLIRLDDAIGFKTFGGPALGIIREIMSTTSGDVQYSYASDGGEYGTVLSGPKEQSSRAYAPHHMEYDSAAWRVALGELRM